MSVARLQAPIVLVHGLFGFDRVRVGGWTLLSYFRGIPEFLGAAGNRVLVARLCPTGGVTDRAAQLKEFILRESPGEPVHLLAHSMGGLDSRWMIAQLGMAERVLTLTTLGTPHRGSSFADWCMRRFERVVRPVLDWLEMPRQAFYDLTTERCRALDAQAPDSPSVRYFSVGGRHDGAWGCPEWQLPYRIVNHREGPNDGVVSLESARHGESFEVWEGDHFSLINQASPGIQLRRAWCERTENYARLVGRLRDEGF